MQLRQILDTEQRVKSYWYQDGIGELSGGAMLLILGIYFALQGYLGERSMLTVILQSGLALVLIAGAFIVRKVVSAFKSRVTYPRTGFIEYRVDEKDLKRRRYWVAAIAFLTAAASVLFYRTIRELDAMLLISGILVGLIFIVLRGRSTGMQRFYVLGIISILLGLGLSLSGLPQAYGLALFYGTVGCISMISGGWALHRYLVENPLPPGATRDR